MSCDPHLGVSPVRMAGRRDAEHRGPAQLDAELDAVEKLGPDHDFSIAPLLTKAPNGRDLVIVQQKSGMAYAVDPDKGTLVWQYKTSDGSGMGGQWGIAADDRGVA